MKTSYTMLSLVVHAGVPSTAAMLPENPQEIASYARKPRALSMQMQHIRFVSPEGKILPLGQETARDYYWADVYDSRLGTVYFGHHVFMRPMRSG